jgi:hypothetical protein
MVGVCVAPTRRNESAEGRDAEDARECSVAAVLVLMPLLWLLLAAASGLRAQEYMSRSSRWVKIGKLSRWRRAARKTSIDLSNSAVAG